MDARALPASEREAAARTAAIAGKQAIPAYDNVKLYSEYQSSKSFQQKKKWL